MSQSDPDSRLHATVGRFIVQWAATDYEMSVNIHHLASQASYKLDTEKVTNLVVLPDDYKRRAKLFRTVFELCCKDAPETLKRMESILGTLGQIKRRREHLAHGMISMNPNDLTVQIVPSHRDLVQAAASRYELPLQNLEAEADRLRFAPQAVSLLSAIAMGAFAGDSPKSIKKHSSALRWVDGFIKGRIPSVLTPRVT